MKIYLNLLIFLLCHSSHAVTICLNSKNTSTYKLSFQWLYRLWASTYNFIVAWISYIHPNLPKYINVSNQLQYDYRSFHFHLSVSSNRVNIWTLVQISNVFTMKYTSLRSYQYDYVHFHNICFTHASVGTTSFPAGERETLGTRLLLACTNYPWKGGTP